jgi:hypothetical protein
MAITATAIAATAVITMSSEKAAGKDKRQQQHAGRDGKIFFQLNELHQRKSWMPAFAGMTGYVELDGI